MTDQAIAIQLRADIQQAVREMRNARRELGGVGRAGKESARDLLSMKRRLDEVERGMQGIQRAGRLVANVLGALGVGISFKGVIDATIAQERALADVEARIRSTGGAAGFTTQELAQMAGEFQRMTTFGDEAILDMQSVLLTFTRIRGSEFQGATQAILDLATAMNMDLRSAAQQVGRALNDPIAGLSALSRSGIQFSNDQRALIRSLVQMGDVAGAQRVILRELETQFGGAAEAARNTFAGALAGLRNAFGDLLEADGGLEDARRGIEDLTALLSDPATISAANALTTSLIQGFTKAAEAVTTLVEAGQEAGIFAQTETELQRVTRAIEDLERREQQWLINRARFFGRNLETDAPQFFSLPSRSEIQRQLEDLRAIQRLLQTEEERAADDQEGSRDERETAELEHARRLQEIRIQETRDIKKQLADQVKAYQDANKAFETAQKERLQLEQRAKDLRSEFDSTLSGGRDDPIASTGNVIALYREFGNAMYAFRRGDLDGAAEGAEKLEDRLRRAKEEGSLSSVEMERLAGEVAKIWEGLGQGREADAEQNLMTIQSRIEELTRKAAELADIPIGFDEEGAVQEADALRELLTKEFQLKPVQIPVVMQALEAGGSRAPGYASGGYISGPGGPRSDSILARLSNGEFVMPAHVVRRFGVDFMEALRSGRLPKFANGGLVNNLSIPRVPSAAMGGSGQPVHIHLPGGESFSLSGTSDQIDHVQRVFALAALKRGKRR